MKSGEKCYLLHRTRNTKEELSQSLSSTNLLLKTTHTINNLRSLKGVTFAKINTIITRMSRT